jgi:hypothetical protein
MVAIRTARKHPYWNAFEIAFWIALALGALALLLTALTSAAAS